MTARNEQRDMSVQVKGQREREREREREKAKKKEGLILLSFLPLSDKNAIVRIQYTYYIV